MQEKVKELFKNCKVTVLAFLCWLVSGLVLGAVCGTTGTAFVKTIAFVTRFREDNSWVLYLLPLGGLLSVLVIRILKVKGIGTNQIFESTYSDKKVSFLLAPAIFLCSAITHLCGGSAGREGAALQLGGSIATLLGKLFKLSEEKQRILILCGMAAFFSAIFGTPLGACVFALEVVTVGSICLSAVFPVFVSGISAYAVSCALGTEPERFVYSSVPDFTVISVLKVLVIAILGALVSMAFCKSLHFTESIFNRYLKNDFIKAFCGGLIIVLLTVILGTTDYNGGGIEVINRIFVSGEVRYEAFLLKIIFTAITVAAGFKGGEIIPTLFIGATLGGAVGVLLGISSAFGAAVGMAVLFCGVTNCPLATLLISIEMFGAKGMVFYAVAVAVSFLFSGKCSLYSSQRIVNSFFVHTENMR